MAQARVPTSLLTGFLGSGKTTLLNGLLKHKQLADTAIIVNEFGTIGVDHLLVRAGSDNIRLLESGCICCATDGSLTDTLIDLWTLSRQGRIPAFRRVIIETSGLAEPAPIARAIMQDQLLAPRFSLGRIIVTIDAVHGARELAHGHTAVEQLAAADVVILTKTDAADSDATGAKKAIRRFNATAPIIASVHGDVGPEVLIGKSGFVDAPSSGHHHDCEFVERSICSHIVATWSGIAAFTDLCHRTYGSSFVRCKGLLAVEGEPGPILLQGVNGVFGTERLERWPDEDRRSRLICIFREDPKRFTQVLKLLQAEPGTQPPGSLNELEAG